MLKNINDLSLDKKSQIMKQEFEKKSRFLGLFNNKDQGKINCQEFYKKFRTEIARLLIDKKIVDKINYPLEELHLHVSTEMRKYNFNDGVNKISTFFYENDKKFSQIYLSFIKNFLAKQFDFDFYFQKTPTIRIHCPNAENSNHYPRYHTDIGYGHPAQEINFWFSLTKPIGKQKHGFRVMRLKDSLKLYRKYDYHFENLINDAVNSKEFNNKCEEISPEIDTDEGELLAFDSRCFHSGEPLQNHTRISMDIRIISVEDYNNLPIIYQGAGRRKILFAPGGCYHKLTSKQL